MTAPRPLRTQRAPWRAARAGEPLPKDAQRLLQHFSSSPGTLWTRDSLVASLGMNDRAVRKAIETLRHHGFAVLSRTEAPGGYWLARTAAEVEEFRERALVSRIITLSEESRALLRIQRAMKTREQAAALSPALQFAMGIGA